VDFILPLSPEGALTVPQYAAEVAERLDKAKLVTDHPQAAADSASRWYNTKSRPHHFEQGTPVRVYYPRMVVGRSPTWQSFYKTEGEVVKKIKRRH